PCESCYIVKKLDGSFAYHACFWMSHWDSSSVGEEANPKLLFDLLREERAVCFTSKCSGLRA
ncbi:MAG: hypothetical protein M1368_07200, partial [Thaumarchaeota archaeon]|nr:hypothetical protein [Nitrososphaerota archaeon]